MKKKLIARVADIWSCFKKHSIKTCKHLKMAIGETIPFLKRMATLFLVIMVLGLTWHAFLSIVGDPPIDTTSSMIMVWISASLLLLTIFPSLLDRIKKIKVKDFELELQQTVNRVTSEGLVSIVTLDDHILSHKREISYLSQAAVRASRSPNRPILLTVNVGDRNYISIPMLYLYLVYLDIIAVNTTVLFVSTRQRIEQISDIGHGIIIGAISGKKVVKAFQDRFPELLRLYSSFNHSNENNNGELFVFENITGDSINELYNRFSAMINDTDVRRRGPLKEREVSNWLASDLCNHTVEATLEGGSFSDTQTAIDRSDDYILVVKSKRLQAIVPLCKMTNEIARKAISRR